MTGHEKIAARNIKESFNYIVGSYYNSLQDDCLEDIPDTAQEVKDLIYFEAMQHLYLPGVVSFDNAPKEMRFAGTEFCKNYIEKLWAKDEDVAEIAEVKGW